MSAEEIRSVFAEHHDDESRVRHAIYAALDQLEWITDRETKAKSPYSLSRLTAGLEHQDAIIATALNLLPMFKLRYQLVALKDRLDDPYLQQLSLHALAIVSIRRDRTTRGQAVP